MDDKKLSKSDESRSAVHSAQRSVARSQGGDTSISSGEDFGPDKEVGGLYAGGLAKDHDYDDLMSMPFWH